MWRNAKINVLDLETILGSKIGREGDPGGQDVLDLETILGSKTLQKVIFAEKRLNGDYLSSK